MADWSQLPYDLTALIASHLYTIGEFILFSAVCRSWQLVYLNRDWISTQPNPWLMLGHYYAHGIPTRQFINLSIMKVYRIPLPEAHGHQCWGTCHGWIVTIGPGFAICLLNPVTRVPINLPPLPDLRSTVSYKHNWFEAIQRATVVKFRGSFLTMVIYGLFCRLAFAKPGDNEWTLLSNSTPLSSVVCFEGRLWALSLDGSLKILDIDSPSIVDFASPPEDVKGMNLFLVESSDKLLVVSQRYHFISLKFRVYNFDTLTNEWSVIHELGNNVILMDGYNCYSVYAFGYMERNCIYYAGQNFKMLSLDRDRYRTDCCITRYNIKFSSSYVYRIADYSHPSNVALWMVATL